MDEETRELPTSRNWRGVLDRRFLELLVCPLTKGPLHLDEARGELVSPSASLAYPVRDGIPVLLVSEARRLAETSGQ